MGEVLSLFIGVYGVGWAQFDTPGNVVVAELVSVSSWTHVLSLPDGVFAHGVFVWE